MDLETKALYDSCKSIVLFCIIFCNDTIKQDIIDWDGLHVNV